MADEGTTSSTPAEFKHSSSYPAIILTGASSSSNSEVEADDGPEYKRQSYSTNFPSHCGSENSCAVSSSGHTASSSQAYVVDCGAYGGCGAPSRNYGIVGLSRLSSNPFAIKTSTPTRSIADSTENKESRPLVAPPTLKLDNSAPVIVLRPSALAVQAEMLKLMNKHESSSKQDGKENSSDESNVVKEARFAVSESNGKVSKSELFSCGISTSSDITVSSSSKTYVTENSNSFSLAATKSDELSSNGGFVFGQNLHERALNYDSSSDHPASPTDTHNLTFEEAALKKEELEKMEQRNQEEKIKSLSESAKEYESRQVKRKFDEVTVITGEEEESNVLQINCKLFAFDKINMNWQERGRGILRLNDREHHGMLHSRVVMRIQGSLRVALNTKVWAGMSVEHPSQKSVRLTAFDPQGVKVFLVMAQPKDAEQLFDALNWRVTTLRATDTRIDDSSSPTVEEATSSSTLPDDSGTPCKQSRLSDSCGADSSTETNFTSQDTPAECGFADSTDVQS